MVWEENQYPIRSTKKYTAVRVSRDEFTKERSDSGRTAQSCVSRLAVRERYRASARFPRLADASPKRSGDANASKKTTTFFVCSSFHCDSFLPWQFHGTTLWRDYHSQRFSASSIFFGFSVFLCFSSVVFFRHQRSHSGIRVVYVLSLSQKGYAAYL